MRKSTNRKVQRITKGVERSIGKELCAAKSNVQFATEFLREQQILLKRLRSGELETQLLVNISKCEEFIRAGNSCADFAENLLLPSH